MAVQSWIAVGASLVIAVFAGVAEHRRTRRADPDRVGMVPWAMIQLLALFVAAIVVGSALHWI